MVIFSIVFVRFDNPSIFTCNFAVLAVVLPILTAPGVAEGSVSNPWNNTHLPSLESLPNPVHCHKSVPPLVAS